MTSPQHPKDIDLPSLQPVEQAITLAKSALRGTGDQTRALTAIVHHLGKVRTSVGRARVHAESWKSEYEALQKKYDDLAAENRVLKDAQKLKKND